MAITLNGTTGITAPGTETFGSGTALGGATNPIVSMAQGASGYVQSYIINNTNGGSSSADIVAYPSNGSDSHGWVDMGITSLTYNDATYTITGPNESYLFASAPSGSSTTGNLVIATDNTGTANSIQFYTNGFTQAKSAAKMVIDGSTGNVGIGTASPASKLDVTATSADAVASLTVSGVQRWQLKTLSASGNFAIYNQTSSTQPVTVDTSGNLLVGGTSATNSAKFESFFNGGINSGIVSNDTSSTASVNFFIASLNGTNIGSIQRVSSTSAVAYLTSSDYRLKENIAPMTGALATVAQLKPVTYNWKEGSSEGQGFIAHELQEVVPECVSGEKDAVDADGNPVYQGIDTSFLVATLTAAIQEQQAIITQLQADVTALKAAK
jgi:Chaperone of endosialidase